MHGARLLFAAALVALVVSEEPAEDKPAPNPAWARKPEPAKDFDSGEPDVVKVSYSADELEEPEAKPHDPRHVRAGDDKVVIHPDVLNGYNAGGDYLKGKKDAKEACCTICPRNKECEKFGTPGCYSKCLHFCGPQCVVPGFDPKSGAGPSTCTIGIDCGMMMAAAAASGSSSSTPTASMITAQDMNPAWKSMKAPKSDNTPDHPTPKWARPPLKADGATGPAPTKIPVMPEDAHHPDVMDATGAAAPDAPGQPYAMGQGPATPTEMMADAKARMEQFAANQKVACMEHLEAGCAARKGCSWCSVTTKCMEVAMPCGAPKPDTSLLQTGSRYTRSFRSGPQ